MYDKLRHFLSMIRFSHTIFALPFALLAAMMAWRLPVDDAGTMAAFRIQDLLGILVCMVGARSAAMAFNRLADRKIDAENPRTKSRHLPAGILSVGQVILFTVACAAIFILGTLLFYPNLLPFYLSIPILFVLLMYSYTKRFTMLAHYWLGLALMLAPIAAWIAIRGDWVLESGLDMIPAMLVGLVVLFWVGGFDIIYACQDYEYDVDAKLKSIPAKLGIPIALRIAQVSHVLMIACLIALPFSDRWTPYPIDLGWIYWMGVFAIGSLLVYEHLLVRPNDLTRVNRAFFHVNAVVSIGLLAIVTIDLLV